MNKLTLFLLGFVLVLNACKKDDASAADKLTGQWKLVSSTSSFVFNGNTQTLDVYAQLGACQKDNFFEFKTGGVAVTDEGPTKCASGDPQQTTGTWALAQNDTHLIVAGIGYNFDGKIVELTDTTLHVTYSVDNNGIVTTYDSVFQKI